MVWFRLTCDGIIRLAILWNDQRTGKAVDAIETAIGRQELIGRTGNPAITGFVQPIVWLRTNQHYQKQE